MKHNDHFTIRLPNNKKLKFKTKEAFSHVNEVIAKGKYANNYELYIAVKNCSTGFEYSSKADQNNKEYSDKFNNIIFEA